MRLRSRCTMATALPTIMERIASAAIMLIQFTFGRTGLMASKRRTSAIRVAAFGATESQPATGVGAPW
jgi:hypothetical protein